jgi:hypothetical protein
MRPSFLASMWIGSRAALVRSARQPCADQAPPGGRTCAGAARPRPSRPAARAAARSAAGAGALRSPPRPPLPPGPGICAGARSDRAARPRLRWRGACATLYLERIRSALSIRLCIVVRALSWTSIPGSGSRVARLATRAAHPGHGRTTPIATAARVIGPRRRARREPHCAAAAKDGKNCAEQSLPLVETEGTRARG